MQSPIANPIFIQDKKLIKQANAKVNHQGSDCSLNPNAIPNDIKRNYRPNGAIFYKMLIL